MNREAIARIIEPWAWTMRDKNKCTTGIADIIEESLQKADAILYLERSPHEEIRSTSDGFTVKVNESGRIIEILSGPASRKLRDAALAKADEAAPAPDSSGPTARDI